MLSSIIKTMLSEYFMTCIDAQNTHTKMVIGSIKKAWMQLNFWTILQNIKLNLLHTCECTSAVACAHIHSTCVYEYRAVCCHMVTNYLIYTSSSQVEEVLNIP